MLESDAPFDLGVKIDFRALRQHRTSNPIWTPYASARRRRLFAKMVAQAGFIKSRPDPTDKRGVILSLTDRGANKMRAAIKHKGEAFRRRLDGWSKADLRLFTTLLRRFNTSKN